MEGAEGEAEEEAGGFVGGIEGAEQERRERARE